MRDVDRIADGDHHGRRDLRATTGLMQRQDLLCSVADRIVSAGAALVGIDGVDGAGKTSFADELAAVLTAHGRPVIRAGIDSFHHPRRIRYRRGRSSPEGYFLDSFDYDAVRRVLLDPLGPGGSRRYRVAAFDHVADIAVDADVRTAPEHAILVFDGIFLHRPELARYWDFSVFLRVGFDVSVSRCAGRDGTSPDPSAPSNRRYVDGQRYYLACCRPEERATVVVDNTDLPAPYPVRCHDGCRVRQG